MISDLLFQLNRLEDSIKDCTSALELDKKYLKALLRRAKSHLDLEHYEDAVHDYEAANRIDRFVLQNMLILKLVGLPPFATAHAPV